MSAVLRVNAVRFPVTALGPGRRVGVWVQGCTLACRGCMAQNTWPAGGGYPAAVDRLLDAWRDYVADGATGLTISGGEPLQQAEAVAALIDGVHRTSGKAGGEHDVLLYTGYEVDELSPLQRATLERADAVMVGRYDIAKPSGLIWRGSGNQQLILNTDLGVRRFDGIDMSPQHWPLQIAVGQNRRVEIVGVPHSRRHLLDITRELRAQGFDIDYESWRDPDAGQGVARSRTQECQL